MAKAEPVVTPWEQEERKIYLRDIFFLVLIVVLSILISEQVLLSEDASTVDRIFTYLLLFIPVGTLNLIAHYYYRNRRIRQTGNLRSSLRYRLSLAFMLIAIIPSIPIFLISANNVETVTESLFNVEVADAMDSANATIRYYEYEISGRLYDDLIAASPVFGRAAAASAEAEVPGSATTVPVPAYDPLRAIQRVFDRQVLIPGRDFAGVYGSGEFQFASSKTQSCRCLWIPSTATATGRPSPRRPCAAATTSSIASRPDWPPAKRAWAT